MDYTGYARGSGSSFQIGLETEYGVKVEPTEQINFLNESITLDVIRESEESLLMAKTIRSKDVMGYSSGGDFSVILKPENIKPLLYLSLGKEEYPELKSGTTGVYKHSFTLTEPDETLPSFTAVIDRKFAVPAYTGLKVSSFSLEAQSADYIRSSLSLQGSGKEEEGEVVTLPIPTLKAFRFVNGSLTLDGVEFGEVSSVKLDINNQLDEGDFTLGSGYYRSEGQHNEREVSISIDCFYNAKSNTIRENKYKTDGATANIILTFESPEEIETGEKIRFEVILPNVVITEANPNVSGKEKIELTLEGMALEGIETEPITINVFDGDEEKAFSPPAIVE